MSDTTQVEEKQTVTGTTTFGVGSVGKPTPLWATWVFRVYFYLASFVTIVLTTSKHIPAQTALDILEYMAFGGIAVHMVSKMFGIDVTQVESDAKSFIPGK